ncbi:nuclear transport factor 2 family protein [Mycobacterium sp. Aquia_216]|uniref:nuclear transport factor 2 family protein n=1 Tax=Mycobacterium sp. Aquia_216 TaxID=2991729 RepID=UPI00227CF43D|nr:nuclear transport factor 2 family protein [Mycobacterium sp. Aquia_216]WAJ45496.1 nuclear transport factor 2 family protein [Mycobacterium sp. Aquia_216]
MGGATGVGTGIVEQYLKCLTDHDWDGLAATVADEGLTREGPFCDVIEGKAHYLAYLRKILTTLAGHRLEVRRVSHVTDRVSYVELIESFEIDGMAVSWPECILFEQGDGGLISHVSVFFKQRRADQA